MFKSSKKNRPVRDYRELISREAVLGGQLFGQIPEGTRREFFCLNEHTWVWHEEWTDASGQYRVVTTRYDVRPNGILKAQDGQPYRYISPAEAQNLFTAVDLYNKAADADGLV